MFAWLPNPLIIPVGLAIGILIAAPVGPVNVLCVQRAIERGTIGGVVAGSGAALADGLVALAAALGVSVVTGLVEYYRDPIQMIGGLALLLFGGRLMVSHPHVPQPQMTADASARAAIRETIWDLPKSFFLTITNPAAVLGLVAIFGGISSFVEVGGKIDALTMVAAIVTGSMIWWIGLSALVAYLRRSIDERWFAGVNRIAGGLLIAFGVVLLSELGWTVVTGEHIALAA